MKCNNCDLNLKRKDCSETEQLECDFEDLFWKYVGQFGILDLLDLMLKNMDIYEKKKVIKKILDTIN